MGLGLKMATYLLGECSRSWLKALGEGVKIHFAVGSPVMGSEKKAFGLGQHRAHCPCHCWCSCPTYGCLLASQSSPKLPQHQGGFPKCLQGQMDSAAFSLFLSVPLCCPYQLLVPGLMDGLNWSSDVLLSSWLHFPRSTVQETVFLSFILLQSVSNPSVDLTGYGYTSCIAREWQVCILTCLY